MSRGTFACFLSAALLTACQQRFTLSHEELAKLPGFRQPKDQDIAQARRLLAEAGYPNGFKTNSSHGAGFSDNPEWNEAAAGQLKKIGIEVTIEPLEVGVLKKRGTECAMEMDMYVEPSAGSTSMPTRNYAQWATRGSENYCKFSHAEFDRLFAEQFDGKKRWDIVKKLQLILLEEVPMLATPDRAPTAGWHPYLHNWRGYGHLWSFPFYPTAELIWTEKR